MSGFRTDPPELVAAASATRQGAAELRAELERLRRLAEEVLDGQWTGRAAAAFDRAWTGWHRAAAETLTALDGLADDLGACSLGYGAADRDGAQALSVAAS